VDYLKRQQRREIEQLGENLNLQFGEMHYNKTLITSEYWNLDGYFEASFWKG
jgi:hypothetical protein